MIADQLQRTLGEAKASYLGRTWDIYRAAALLSRHEFLIQYVARETRTKKGRGFVEGFQVIKTPKGWTYVHENHKKVHMVNPTTADRLYDNIRRTVLGYYVRKAEHARLDFLHYMFPTREEMDAWSSNPKAAYKKWKEKTGR